MKKAYNILGVFIIIGSAFIYITGEGGSNSATSFIGTLFGLLLLIINNEQ